MCLIENANVKTAEENLRVFKIFASEPIGVHPEAEGADKLKTLWFSQDGSRMALSNRASIDEILSNPSAGFNEGHGYGCFRDIKQAMKYQAALPTEHTAIKELTIPAGSRYRVGKIRDGETGDGLIACQAERLSRVGG